MKRHAFLAMSSILLVSIGLWAGQFARDAWSAPSDGAGPDDTAAKYALTVAGDEPARGTILFEYYWGTDGSLSSLQSLPTFPNFPDDREWRASLEGPTDWRDHYGTCVRGYLYPPATGNYTFWIASDDQSQLWLSTDETPAHMVQIAGVPQWTPPRDFDNTGGGFGGPQQKSAPIRLTAGKKYYIEALQAEGIGGDNLGVAWQGPGIPQRVIIAGKYLSPVIGPQDVTDPNLLGWWKLDETSGTIAADASGNGHDGAIQGTPTRVDGPPGFGKALYYNGQNPAAGWVNCGTWNPSAATGQLTVTFWAKWAGPVGPDNWQGLVGKRNDWDSTGAGQMWEFEIDATNNQIRFFRGDSYPNCGGRILPIGEWTHVAATFDGATLVFYIDGQETGQGAFSFGPTTDAMITIGCDDSSGWNSFNGALDDVRVYDRALLAGEIRWLTGLFQGEYFTNMTLSGSPALTRLDREINFNWGTGEVFPGTSDWCSVRWTGEVEPAFTEPYTFYVNADDGARLWLDDDLIINAWQDQAATEYASAPIQLAAGQRSHIRLEWYENTGEAVCELRWSSPSTPKQVISSGRQRGPGSGAGGNPTMTLDPTNGPVGTTITIAGSGFAANTSGNVSFAGTSNLVTTTPTGTFSTTMTVPSVSAGNHPVEADIPSGGSMEASATFTITTAGMTAGTMTLDPEIGHVMDAIAIAGSGFSAGTAGRVFFDTNRNDTYDSGEPVQSLTTSPAGAFSTTLTVPTVVPGNYPVLADFSIGGSVEGTASFSVVGIPIGMGPYLTLVPFSGSSGTRITILGGRFAAGASGRVFFDSNRNGSYDSGEPMQAVSSLGGSLTASLTVPSVPIGSYSIRADCPTGGSVEASGSFTVTVPAPTLTLDRTSGGYYYTHRLPMITGKGFAPNATGDIWFDTNGDGLHEDSESDVPAVTSSTGELIGPSGLYIPNAPGGIYTIWADIPRGGPVETSASFTVIPSISEGPTISIVGSEQFVTVGGFSANTTGRAFFDSDGDNAYDVGEPIQSPTTDNNGSARTSLIVPNVGPGDYKIVCEFPIGGPAVSRSVTVVAPTAPLTVMPTSGTWGADFRADVLLPVNSEYVVFFDIDRDNTWDEGEPSGGGTMSSGGVRAHTLQVPGVQAGAYSVLLQSPFGGPIVDSATFTVTAPVGAPEIQLDPTTGPTGTVISITGAHFAASTSGNVTFGSAIKSVTTLSDGTFSTTLAMPFGMTAGPHAVQADIPSGGSVEASASFTVTAPVAAPEIVLDPTTGPAGTVISITGAHFAGNTSGNVTLGSTSVSVTTSSTGTFSTTLTVPSGLGGVRHVVADIPAGGSTEASAPFTVKGVVPTPSITLSPTHGDPDPVVWTTVSGTGFAANTSGRVFFDRDGDGVWDSTERNKTGTTTATGTFAISLDVFGSALPHQTYQIRADFPEGGSIEASATFTIP